MIKLKHHTDLTPERWFRFSLMMQLANAGVDVSRSFRHRREGRMEDSEAAFERAMELFFLTVEDPKNKKRLKEILRARAVYADLYAGINEFNFTEEWLDGYFMDFNYLAAVQRGR